MYTYTPSNVIRSETAMKSVEYFRIFAAFTEQFIRYEKLYASIKGGKIIANLVRSIIDSVAIKKKARYIFFFLLLLIPIYLHAKYIFRFHRVTIVGKLVIFRSFQFLQVSRCVG